MRSSLVVHDMTDSPAWDRRVGACTGANIYCDSAWGAYKTRRGARVRRAVITGDSREFAFVQWQEHRRGPARFIHVQGGPVLTESGERRAEDVFDTLIAHLDLGWLDILGVGYEQFESREATLALLMHGFTPVVLARNHTLELDLTQGLEVIQAAMEPRWRKALRKAERNPDLSAHFLEDRAERLAAFDAFAAMYRALRERKGFASSLKADAYRDIAAGDKRLLFLEIREKGERVLVRIAHRSAERCTDFYTASNERARATSAATLAVWRVIEQAQAEGCRTFDFGGIDPAENRAVFEFKRGLCRTVRQNDPLWLYSRSPVTQKAAAMLLSLR